MGQRGPAPMPDNVHRLNGNPSKKSLGTGSDVPIEIPAAPEHLDDEAQKEWTRISNELFRLGLIAKVDRAMLAVYCTAYSRWVKAELKMQELGDDGLVQRSPNGYQQMSSWLQISNRAVEQMKSAAAEFGMSPSARVRVNPNPQFDMFGDGKNSQDQKGSAKGKANPAEKYF